MLLTARTRQRRALIRGCLLAGWLVPALVITLATAPALAQEEVPTDRFFDNKTEDDKGEDDDKKPEDTLVQGSLTSTTFAYTEAGGTITLGGAQNVQTASPVNRLFTDLRAQMDAKHISGGSLDFRFDGRARLSNSCTLATIGVSLNDALYDGLCRVQSGTFGDTEYEAREVYVKRTSDKLDMYLGRQYVLDLAATKIDGVRGVYRSSNKWSWIGFAGLYPSRTSRSVFDDYPVQQFVDGMGAQQEQRVMPIAAGGGGAYRFQQMYGSLGVVGIAPRAQRIQLMGGIAPVAQAAGEEPLRAFVTASGYWRQSTSLDVYHFGVFDFQGTSQGLTNLSVGANYRPSSTMRITAAINHIDTETLDVIAQDRLENPDNQGGLVQNNVEVTRIASDSARVGVSVALSERRFEVSVSGQVRQRPDITVQIADANGTPQTILGERAAEVIFQVLDRKSYKGWRLGGMLLNTLPVGGDNAFRSETRFVRVFGSNEIRDGRGQLDVDVSYLSAADEDQDAICVDLVTCFGSSDIQTIGVSGTLVYRLKQDWLFAGHASAARQSITTNQLGALPTNTLLSAFVRLAYRF